MEENDRLQKQVSHLVYENGHMKHQLHTVNLFIFSLYEDNIIILLYYFLLIVVTFLFGMQASGTTTDNSCESVVVSGQQHQQQNSNHPQHLQRDANNPAGWAFYFSNELLDLYLQSLLQFFFFLVLVSFR